MEKLANEHHYKVLICQSNELHIREKGAQAFQQRQIDGMLDLSQKNQ